MKALFFALILYFGARETMQLPWIGVGDMFPHPAMAWNEGTAAPGLLAVGGDLSAERLKEAYRQGIFPWYSDGQPVLWWSPDPRMVLPTASFRLHRSFRKILMQFMTDPRCNVRFDTAFSEVISNCAAIPRKGQNGTWIVDDIQMAYMDLHQQGVAHSVETWIDGELVGGLYCIGLGRAVFGESMFTNRPNASKIALAALVAWSRHHEVQLIDCQQETAHLASLGARPIPRGAFLDYLDQTSRQPSPAWDFDPVYWNTILPS